MNGDSRPDLVTPGAGGASVSVLLGNGDGTFQPELTQSAGPTVVAVAVADLNGDQRLDVVTADGNSSVTVLLGNGDGSLQAGAPQPIGPGGSLQYVTDVALGDFNGDNNIDLVTTNIFLFTVSVSLGNGDGTFDAATYYSVGGPPDPVGANGPWHVTIGDLNGDGSTDLVTANYQNDSVSVLLGNGDGTFQSQVQYAAGDGPVSVAMGDLDADGNLDLAVATLNSASMSVLFGNGDGTFQSPVVWAAGAAPESAAIGDLNGDGRPDILAADIIPGLSVLLNGSMPVQGATYVIDDLLI
jgi:hypothetical protein